MKDIYKSAIIEVLDTIEEINYLYDCGQYTHYLYIHRMDFWMNILHFLRKKLKTIKGMREHEYCCRSCGQKSDYLQNSCCDNPILELIYIDLDRETYTGSELNVMYRL